jgi:hypothetical protein
MTDDELLLLQHDWHVLAEHDAGYVLGRCRVCATEDLLDLVPQPRRERAGSHPA